MPQQTLSEYKSIASKRRPSTSAANMYACTDCGRPFLSVEARNGHYARSGCNAHTGNEGSL